MPGTGSRVQRDQVIRVYLVSHHLYLLLLVLESLSVCIDRYSGLGVPRDGFGELEQGSRR